MYHLQKHSSVKHYVSGCQVTFNRIRLFFQANQVVLKILVCLFLIGVIGYCYTFSSHETLWMGFFYYLGWIPSKYRHLSAEYFYFASNYLQKEIGRALFVSGTLTGLLLYGFIRYLTQTGEKQHSPKFIRGMQRASLEAVKALVVSDGKASTIQIDGMPLIKNSEVQHTLMHGTTGSGKSQLIRKKLRKIRERGERAVIYDKGCSLLPEFFQAGDVILNPFDVRCVAWDLWDEAPTAPQLENIAETLIPLQGNVDPFWVKAARTIFVSTAFKMRHDADRSIEKLVQLLLTMELTDLEKYVKGTESASLTSGKMEKTAISIRSILTTYVKSMRFLFGVKKGDTPAFSVRQWVLDDTQKNWLFISTTDENSHALTPLISMWLASAATNLLSLPEDKNRRIYFEYDEITSLHQLPSLHKTLAEARKFGGCFDIGMQSFALMKAVYGQDLASGIFDLLNTRFFFRSPSQTMAKFISEELGQMEVEETQENESYGNHQRDGVSRSAHRLMRSIIIPSEIMMLENLECYVRLPGNYPVFKMTLQYQEGKTNVQSFILRDIPEMAVIEERIVETMDITPMDEKKDVEVLLEEDIKKENHPNVLKKNHHKSLDM